MRKSLRPFDVSHLVVRIPNWIGDAVFSIPTVRALAHCFPEARLTLLGPKGPVDLLGEIGGVDETVALDPSSYRRRLSQSWKLRRHHSQLGFVLPESFSSALELQFAGVRTRVGRPTQGRRFLLSHPVAYGAPPRSRHVVDEYLELAAAAGSTTENRVPDLRPSSEGQRDAHRILAQRSGMFRLGLIPGAVFGPAKRWSHERYAELAGRFPGAEVVVFGSEHERALGQFIASSDPDRTLNLAGRTSLPVLAACLATCSLVVGNDTGATHLAAAVGVPVVGIYGSTHPGWTGLRGRRCRIVRTRVECAPCYLRRCNRDSSCLEDMTVDEVWQVCVGLLRDTSSGTDDGQLSAKEVVNNGS